ncbi:MAG TPA: methyltransferase domain-containing protein [Chitinivibrionales bacterium]
MAPVQSSILFSNQKHAEGQWNTRSLQSGNRMVRFMASYLSFKRSGVDNLAQTVVSARFVLDAGAGKAAYSHWFIGRNALPCLIAADWSFEALRGVGQPKKGRILRVCADLQKLPFKSGSINALFSIDTLGHVPRVAEALDEFVRVCETNAPLFIHSECGNYRMRWPDRALIAKVGKDIPADYDGHCSLMRCEELYALFSQRFIVRSFFSPAGYAGWLLGYPEKYRPAFTQAGWRLLAMVAAVMEALKRIGVCRAGIKLLNALTNHAEKYFGLSGGGSCFATMRRP